MGPRTGVDPCGKSRLHREFSPRTVQPVASRYADLEDNITRLDYLIACTAIREYVERQRHNKYVCSVNNTPEVNETITLIRHKIIWPFHSYGTSFNNHQEDPKCLVCKDAWYDEQCRTTLLKSEDTTLLAAHS